MNSELKELLNKGELAPANLTNSAWRGLIFDMLESENIGTILIKVRPLYDGAEWNESLALTWLQLLNGLRVVQTDWSILSHRCPQLLDDDFMVRLYSPEALEKAASSNRYVPPDICSIGDVVLELMTEAVVHVVNCSHCSH